MEPAEVGAEAVSVGEFAHRFVETNGIRMHYAEAGSGPLVLMCHGFPESWYSWRHQKVVLTGVGHWTQQERPHDVNRLLIEFLKSL